MDNFLKKLTKLEVEEIKATNALNEQLSNYDRNFEGKSLTPKQDEDRLDLLKSINIATENLQSIKADIDALKSSRTR